MADGEDTGPTGGLRMLKTALVSGDSKGKIAGAA